MGKNLGKSSHNVWKKNHYIFEDNSSIHMHQGVKNLFPVFYKATKETTEFLNKLTK